MKYKVIRDNLNVYNSNYSVITTLHTGEIVEVEKIEKRKNKQVALLKGGTFVISDWDKYTNIEKVTKKKKGD